MRKIAAHYFLKPDGSWGSKPVISLNEHGVITEVREMGVAFKEEPGLEFYGGIIIPGFVEDLSILQSSVLEDVIETSRFFNRLFIKGTTRVILPDCPAARVYADREKPEVCFRKGTMNQVQWPSQLAWDKLLGLIGNADSKTFLRILHENTCAIGQRIQQEKIGVIEPGARPGLLLLRGVDLESFTPTRNMSIKFLEP
ncbi:hypothetical protein DMA11_03980 [Marinilabiliaceae bacterium JC017]|nr:hypothetical protein DMA11_03980 [Marinilabiliaceae bacterium JC017]